MADTLPNIYSKSDSLVPQYEELNVNFNRAMRLLDDIVLKNYVVKLNKLEIVPYSLTRDQLDREIENVRLFKISEMVYEKDEFAAYKLASVFNALSSVDCSVFVIVDGKEDRTDFYMGVRSSTEVSPNFVMNIMENSLKGQFPGTRVDRDSYTADKIVNFVSNLKNGSCSAVTCIANRKDSESKTDSSFIQGLEKLANAMQGQCYTAIILANSTTAKEINNIRNAYEGIYSQLFPFASAQISYSTNMSVTQSVTNTQGTSSSVSKGKSHSDSDNYSKTSGNTSTKGISQQNAPGKVLGGVSTAAGVLGAALAPLTGGLSLAVGGVISTVTSIASQAFAKATSESETTSDSKTKGHTHTAGSSHTHTDGKNSSEALSSGSQTGNSQNLQLTLKDKKIEDVLERLDIQLKRMKEFESLGMWQCAAYFMSNDQCSAEIAAATYRSIMKGENSGVEVSAINSWGSEDKATLNTLHNYLATFTHPIFRYQSHVGEMQVMPCAFVSSNELALHMGLPRKSVAGFPVIEHISFGKEVISYASALQDSPTLYLGNVFNMNSESKQRVNLNIKSLSMHTFIAGSTGSGKSNATYEIIRQLDNAGKNFMVIEPAKGEYKNVFGNQRNVTVLGTNPKCVRLLKINPFKFPIGNKDKIGVHVLEHIDRLVEIFNVCWPMYAAMPAILKEATLKAYEHCGWNLSQSENRYSDDLFPTFKDLQSELMNVIEGSAYSQENKGNYIGSLVTRVKSLTNGLNGQIFTSEETDNTLLFDCNTIIDLSRIGSQETKALIMGMLIMRLNEHRSFYAISSNAPLKHVTILEEAHNLLKKTSTEQNMEGSNVAGKSVEMLANSMAEMRTYGEGFIIVDQSPNAVDLSAIRNTNTKIIMRLPEESDRRLAGKTAGLRDDQLEEIAKLPLGVAVVYQNDWAEPILCKINKLEVEEHVYKYYGFREMNDSDIDDFNRELLKLLLKGRLANKVEVNVEFLLERLPFIELSTKNKVGILKLIEEYKFTNFLNLWRDENFTQLSDLVADYLDLRMAVSNCIETETSFESLTTSLINLISIRELSNELKLTICQCLMKDYARNDTEKISIYAEWRNNLVQKKGGIL